MNNKRQTLLSIFLIILYLTVLLTSAPISFSQEELKVPQNEGIEASWEKEHESEIDDWNWRNIAWEFGPYPTYTVYLANGTEVLDNNFIPLEENFTVIIKVKKDIFTGNEALGGAALNWHFDIVNVTDPMDTLGWANIRMEYLNYLIGEDEKHIPHGWKNGSFQVWSEFFNETEQTLEVPEVHFKSSQLKGFVNITQILALTGTNLWNADTPPQSLPVEDNIIYSPGVKVGDWANYDLQVIIDPYDPAIPYDGPKNSTIKVEILNVVESNVTFSLTIEEEGNVETDEGWIDVSTGNSSPDMQEIKGIIAANLTVGDSIYPDFNEVISDTQVTNIFGADRILNLIEWPDGDYSWDRSSGVLVGMNVNYHMEMDEPDPYSDPGFEPNPKGIYIWDGDRSYVNETDKEWTIHITGRFNGTLTPMGPYHVNLEVYNSNHDWIDFGYLAWEANQSPHRMIAVGKPGLSSSGYYETWTFQKLDLEYKEIYSVSRGSPWIMRMNVTSPNLANVTIGLRLNDNVRTYVNVTGWYTQIVEEEGGWQYNSTSGSYFWNSSAVITRSEEVYGPHLEERWLWYPHRNNVTIMDRYWDETTEKMEKYTRTEEIWGENIYLIYDHADGNFSLMQGFSYWTYDPKVGYHRDVRVLKPLNTSDPTTQFYNLNTSQCNAFQNGVDEWTIDFVGSFNDTIYNEAPDDVYWIEQPAVYKKDGHQIWADWDKIDWNGFNVAIDKMVAVTKFFKDSKEMKGWFLPLKPGDSFILQSKLQGASNLYDDIDSVGVRIQTGEGRWDPTENYWSDVEIRLLYDKYEGTLISETYNRTERSTYSYGTYWGWEAVDITGYHNKYNMTTGNWEWINETYKESNWTQLEGYHWEYYTLNQTEYTIDPDSPDIWIDRNERWLPWDDPAYKVSESYATLLDANLTLLTDRINANLNISINSNAPEARYWWEVFYGNRTFGIDYSQSWDEHTVTEWTETNVYYVNSSGTGDEKWYVEKPSQPYYSVLNGKRYRVWENPYIIIGNDIEDGDKEFIKQRDFYEYWSGEDRVEYLFRDQWDPSLQREPRYYELQNGTRIYVEQGFKVILRDIKLEVADAYYFDSSGEKKFLENGTVFCTYMPHAEHYEYYNEDLDMWIWCNYYELINGSRIYRDDVFENMYWNSTTQRHRLTEKRYSDNSTFITVEYGGHCVTLNGTILVTLREDGSWWQPSPSGNGYYLVTSNGTRITHTDPWAVNDYERIVDVGGKRYLIDWPNEYYTGLYKGEEITAKRDRGYVNEDFYTIIDGTRREIPYPGALANSWWEIENLESNGGKLLTGKSIMVEGEQYPIHKNGSRYYIIYQDSFQAVTKPSIDLSNYYSVIDGEEYWNLTQTGWLAEYGAYNERMGHLEEIGGTIVTTTGYDSDSGEWQEWNKYGEDFENQTRYLINMTDGSRIDVYSGRYVNIWPVTIGEEVYYTFDRHDKSEMVSEKGGMVWKQYITTLNGTKVYFDWGVNPATWGDELKIDVPGTNYTRLIPYQWEDRYYLDTTFIHNITITDNTDIFYLNDTQVPIGTRFKVWGTNYGPGIRVWTSWDGSESHIEGLPSIYNEYQTYHYLETIDGEKIYCNGSNPFGYDYATQRYNQSIQQWSYYTDQLTGNRSVTVLEDGYSFGLYNNETGEVDRYFTPMGWWEYDDDDCFIVLKNGTRLDFTNEGEGYIGPYYYWERYSIILDDELYFVEDGNALYNVYKVVDSGESYQLFEERYLVATLYRVPVILDDSSTLWMDATSDKILINSSLPVNTLGYYYLINSSDGEPILIDYVTRWWTLSKKVRSEIFQHNWDIERAYPRYNVTVNNVEYFVLDPGPTKGGWWGWHDEDSRYPATFTYLNNDYLIDWHDWERYSWRRYDTIKIDDNSWELQDDWKWPALYTVTINNVVSPIQVEEENVYKEHTTWGPALGWMLEDMRIHTIRTVHDIVIGTPDFDMWGVRSYEIVSETGALDLDGDLTTNDDQYFVRRIHTGSDEWNRTEDRMHVHIWWDPNASQEGDEIHIGSWMGRIKTRWTFTWNETYYWYHASNMSNVDGETMEEIRAIMIDETSDKPKPGYWEIAQMAQNTTWEDLKAKALREGWDWFEDNTHEWEWIWFGTHQNYRTDYVNEGLVTSAGIGFTYEYAGLMLYNDTNNDTLMQEEETTHFFMPEKVGSISFTSPGEGYGDYNATGTIHLNLTDKLDYGVEFNNINGTLFPFDPLRPRDMWGWWDGMVYGADYEVPNLNTKPTDSNIDLISFMVHFNASIGDGTNNEASMKIDERYGDWMMDPELIDGRKKELANNMTTYLRGNEVLSGRSLAASWYVTASTGLAWSIKNKMGETVSTETVSSSDIFDLSSEDTKFATFVMGGTYDWQKPTVINDTLRTFEVSSYTTPIGTFRNSYVSESGKSSSGFDLTTSMYFLTVGFGNWSGYGVYHDPQTYSYISKTGTSYIEPEPGYGPTPQLLNLTLVTIISISVVTISVITLKKKRLFKSQLRINLHNLKNVLI